MNFENIYHRYSVLPALTKVHEHDIFVTDECLEEYLNEKQESIERQQCFFEHEMTDEIYDAVGQCILSHCDRELKPGTFSELAMQLQEDILIHRRVGERDWFAAAHICFPSSWEPAEKIGRSFKTIHEPIPGMNLNSSPQMVRAMIEHGPFERYVWSVMHERRLNNHPSIAKQGFDPENPTLVLKIERQIIVGLPEVQAVLFILRQHFVNEINHDVLFNSILAMSDEELAYKGIDANFYAWIKDQTREKQNNAVFV